MTKVSKFCKEDDCKAQEAGSSRVPRAGIKDCRSKAGKGRMELDNQRLNMVEINSD